MGGRRAATFSKWARGVAIALSLVAVGAHNAPAQTAATVATASHDLQNSDDFRTRVGAALILGRTHAPGARLELEHALRDVHPAVRAAAASALATIGDVDALPVLRQRLASETSASARSQMQSTVATLEGLHAATAGSLSNDARWQSTRYVVALGNMQNRSGVRGDHASDVLRSATRSHAKSIPGALVADGSNPELIQQAAARHIPVLLLDGALQRLSRGAENAQLRFNAQVDYSLRRVPEQMLKGMLSGSATSIGSVSALRDPETLAQLQDEAIDGAVESALRGATQGFGAAAR